MPLIQKANFTTSDSIRACFKHERYRKAPHMHQLAEIVYVIEGELLVLTQHKKRTAKAGDIVVIYPYQYHGFKTDEGKTVKLWMLLFTDTLIMNIIRTEADYDEYEDAVFTPSPELRNLIEAKMIDTKEELYEVNYKEKRHIKALLYPIFDEYLETATPLTVLDKTNTDLINATLKYAKLNFYKNITISDCSRAIGYSKSHIAHCLSKSLHVTFSELRNSFRIGCAKDLLQNKRMSVLNISLECGFNCERSFERAFKKDTGLTPKQYQRNKN